MSATLSDYDAVIEELWPQTRVEDLTFDKTPFWGLLNKDTDFEEKIKHIAIQIESNQGRSVDFATAQANQGSAQYGEWQLTKVSDYAVGGVDGELLETTKTRKASLVGALDNELKGSFTTLRRSLHKGLFGDGTGSLGTLDGVGAVAATTVTISNVENIGSFSKGMYIVSAPTAMGALNPGRVQITSIDRDAGTITAAANWNAAIPNGIPALGVNDYLFVEGDAPNGGLIKKVAGLDGWLPATAPVAGDNWFGKDRSVDPVALAGIRFNGSAAGTISEALQLAGARVNREGNGAQPDTIIMSPLDIAKFGIELGSQTTRPRVAARRADGSAASIGYRAYELETPAGTMKVFSDYQCPQGVAYMLTMSTWKFSSLLAAPVLITWDGLRIRAKANADGFEYRARYRGQLYSSAPGLNCRVQLP